MKTIIDHNPHIALSDLKELFRLSEESASFTANGVQWEEKTGEDRVKKRAQ